MMDGGKNQNIYKIFKFDQKHNRQKCNKTK